MFDCWFDKWYWRKLCILVRLGTFYAWKCQLMDDDGPSKLVYRWKMLSYMRICYMEIIGTFAISNPQW